MNVCRRVPPSRVDELVEEAECKGRIVGVRLVVEDDEERILVATGRYLGEGFDDARLDTLFLTLPISWRGTLAQYAGRLHRLHDQKKEVIVYDYADLGIQMLANMYKRRLRGYRAIGYEISDPAVVNATLIR